MFIQVTPHNSVGMKTYFNTDSIAGMEELVVQGSGTAIIFTDSSVVRVKEDIDELVKTINGKKES